MAEFQVLIISFSDIFCWSHNFRNCLLLSLVQTFNRSPQKDAAGIGCLGCKRAYITFVLVTTIASFVYPDANNIPYRVLHASAGAFNIG
jgi:hypothetical protein